MTLADITARPLSIADLVEVVEREHRLTLQAAGGLTAHAVLAGEALIAIKERVDGSWAQWCASNLEPALGITYAMSFTYMRLARNKDLVPDDVGLAEAMGVIAALNPAQSKYPAEVRDEAQRLMDQGKLRKDVSERLGVPVSTLSAWRHASTRADRERDAKQALLEKQTKERASKVGGDVAKCYAAVRKLIEALDAATDLYGGFNPAPCAPELYESLSEALDVAYKVEDLVGRAVRLA